MINDVSNDIQDENDDAYYMHSDRINPENSLTSPSGAKYGKKFEAPNSTAAEMEFSSEDESVFYTTRSSKQEFSDGIENLSALKVLRTLTHKIASQAKKKNPVKSVEQISLKQARNPSKEYSSDGHIKSIITDSLMAVVSRVPKLQELHAAQLQHGTTMFL